MKNLRQLFKNFRSRKKEIFALVSPTSNKLRYFISFGVSNDLRLEKPSLLCKRYILK